MACGKAIDAYEHEKCWKVIVAEMVFWNVFLILFYIWYAQNNVLNLEMQKKYNYCFDFYEFKWFDIRIL